MVLTASKESIFFLNDFSISGLTVIVANFSGCKSSPQKRKFEAEKAAQAELQAEREKAALKARAEEAEQLAADRATTARAGFTSSITALLPPLPHSSPGSPERSNKVS